MQATARTNRFTTNLTRALVHALFGLVLLTSCNSGSNTSTTGTFAPIITPPAGGGGPISSGGGATPIRIGYQRSASYTLSAPQVALNDNDIALVAWQEEYLSGSSVWVNLLTGGNWDTAMAIDTQDALDPQVAVAPNGNAVVVWTKKVFDVNHLAIVSNTVWARRYVDGTWSPATRISAAPVSDNTFYAFSPAVATDLNSNILVVWTQDDPDTAARSIWSARHNGNSWGAPLRLSNGTRNTYDDARVAVDATGNFIAVWTQDTNLHVSGNPAGDVIPNVWARRYNASGAGTWETAAMIGDAGLATNDGASRPRIAMNSGGDAAVAWEQRKGGVVSIATNLYRAAIWGTTPVVVDTATAPASWPAIALDNAGKALAVWQQSDGTADNGWASRYDGAGWGTPERLASLGIGVSNLRIDMDAAGTALALWQENSISLNPAIKARRYLPASGWASATSVNITGQDPALDLNSDGKALVVAKRAVSNGFSLLTAPWALLYQP